MTRWQHLKHALRWRPGAADTSLSDLRHPSAWLHGAFRGGRTTAGTYVTPQSALSLSAYFACLRTISEDIGKLPLHTYRRLEPRGKQRLYHHPVYPLLHDAPNEDMTAMTFRETVTHHGLGWGNGFAEIVRTVRDVVRALWPIHPSRVIPRRDEYGRLVYDVLIADIDLGSSRRFHTVRLPQRDMLHLRGLGAEGLVGYSIAQLAAESLGFSLAVQQFGAAFFGKGANMSGVLHHPANLSPEAQDRLRQSWKETYQGLDQSFEVVVLEEGMKYERLGIPPNDAQMLETRAFQVREVARWFRMPPHKIADLEHASYSNIEQQSLEYVGDTLMPWTVRWEQELKRKLFADEPEVFAEHLFSGLLRGDQAARSTFYRERFNLGSLSPNDIRELENENPIPGPEGDAYYMQLNMTTLKQIGGAVAVETEPPPQGVERMPSEERRNGYRPQPPGA
jgi:HK97 family phage portal protein